MANNEPAPNKSSYSQSNDVYPGHTSARRNQGPQKPKLRLKSVRRAKSVHNTPYRRNDSNIQNPYVVQIDSEPNEPVNSRVASFLHPSTRSVPQISPARTDVRSDLSSEWVGDNYVVIKDKIEHAKYENNHKFGLVKWKSHLATRPLAERSPQVQALYHPTHQTPKHVKTNSCTNVGNVIYCLLYGWWVAFIYLLIGILMFTTICGYRYGIYCFKLSKYFFWPFGKFIYVPSTRSPTRNEEYQSNYESIELSHSRDKVHYETISRKAREQGQRKHPILNGGLIQPVVSPDDDTAPLINSGINTANTDEMNFSSIQEASLKKRIRKACSIPNICRYPLFWLWVFIGVPFLFLTHLIVFIFTWAFVVSIPVAKIHKTAMFKLLYLDPRTTKIENSDWILENSEHDVVLCTYQAFSRYYVKYTVDGMNVIMFNMFFLVIIALIFNYTVDYITALTSQAKHWIKFLISVFGVIPLAYYIGMAIASISAQSTYAVGAVLNATFGSIVEITLYIATLVHGKKQGTSSCTQSIVKNSLTGSLLLTMLLLPGLCMVVGGLKYPEQNFNARSAGVSSTLLFVSIVGAFAPTFFNKAFGTYTCESCQWMYPVNATNLTNSTQEAFTTIRSSESNYSEPLSATSFQCKACIYLTSHYTFDHVQYLAYVCMALLPIAYFAGMIYSLKTHDHIYKNASESHEKESSPHWGRLKSTCILVLMTVLMSLLADTIAENVMHVLGSVDFITPGFLGATVYAILPDVPELVTGIQFALQGIISLSIEVGNQIAVQICLLQIPVLLLAQIIYPELGFYLLFNDLQLFSVFMSVLVINYIFSDSKTDYFQGTSLLIIYLILLSVIFLAPDSSTSSCLPSDG